MLFVHDSNVLSAGGKAELVVGEQVEVFRKPTERGDQPIYVRRLDARHPWDRLAYFPPDAYQRLAGLAEPEDWTLEAEDSLATSGRLPILESYVRYTFARVDEQHKIAEGVNSESNRVSAFNTGLVALTRKRSTASDEQRQHIGAIGIERGWMAAQLAL